MGDREGEKGAGRGKGEEGEEEGKDGAEDASAEGEVGDSEEKAAARWARRGMRATAQGLLPAWAWRALVCDVRRSGARPHRKHHRSARWFVV